MKDALLKEAWTVVLVSGLTIALAIVLTELHVRLGWTILLLALASILFVVVAVMWLFTRRAVELVSRLPCEVRQVLDSYLDPARIRWLRTTDQLVSLEAEIKGSEVWLISSDLSEDAVGGPFQDVVGQNLRRGVGYRYFVPDRPDMRARVEQVRKRHNSPKNLSFTYLTDRFFFLTPDLDFTIYDPFNETGQRAGYMGIPAVGEKKHYHAMVDDKLVDVIVGNLMQQGGNGKQKRTAKR